MNNNINALLNSLSNLGEIRKADKNIGEYSSTSDNTMSVGAQQYNNRFIVTQEMVNALVKDFSKRCKGSVVNFVEYCGTEIVPGFEAMSQCFILCDEETNKIVNIDDLDLNDLDSDDFQKSFYIVTLNIPIMNFYIDKGEKFKFWAYFSPFQYNIKEFKNLLEQSEDVNLEQSQIEFSVGDVQTLISNGWLNAYYVECLEDFWDLNNQWLDFDELNQNKETCKKLVVAKSNNFMVKFSYGRNHLVQFPISFVYFWNGGQEAVFPTDNISEDVCKEGELTVDKVIELSDYIQKQKFEPIIY